MINHPQLCNGYSFDDTATFILDFIDWLGVNGTLYGIDKDKIMMMGTSSGGHLAQLVGWRATAAKVKGVTMFSAPTDFGEVRACESRIAMLQTPPPFLKP